ncbi:hypothetical protein QTP86_000221 [Hemibagrus guttatus]|nr:hypothetical protein QTP86_000221 [Hemibagrus guttatus]
MKIELWDTFDQYKEMNDVQAIGVGFGMKISRSKTEYMCVNEREGSGPVRLQGEEVKKVQEFKYLGSTVQSNGECGKEVKKRVQAGWNGWRKVSGVLCDRKISARIKGKVYRTVVRPAMLYGLETVSLRKRQESELEVAELKMLRKKHKGPVQCVLGSSHGRGPRRPKPWTKNLAFGTWNVTSLLGGFELVREVEWYRLEIIRLASMHSLCSGTQLLERGWTLFYSGVPHGERRRAAFSSPAQPPCFGVFHGKQEGADYLVVPQVAKATAGAVAARSLVPVAAAIPELSGGQWK